MKGITGYVLGAAVLTLLGGVCLAASTLERQMAHAQQSVATFQYEGLEETLDNAERYFEYGSQLPWVGNGPLNDVRARKAALHYWQGQYDGIVPRQADPVSAIPPDNLELQLVVADALYRTGRAQATDRNSTLEAVKAGIDAYLAVLRNAARHETAAYNYEYLVRLRNGLESRGGAPAVVEVIPQPLGAEGRPPQEDRERQEFKILVPLEDDELGDPGKFNQIQRRG